MAGARSGRAPADDPLRRNPDWIQHDRLSRCADTLARSSVAVAAGGNDDLLHLRHLCIYGIFAGAAAATRRNDHLYLSAIAEAMTGRTRLVVETFNRLVVFGAALCMVWFGYLNFLA